MQTVLCTRAIGGMPTRKSVQPRTTHTHGLRKRVRPARCATFALHWEGASVSLRPVYPRVCRRYLVLEFPHASAISSRGGGKRGQSDGTDFVVKSPYLHSAVSPSTPAVMAARNAIKKGGPDEMMWDGVPKEGGPGAQGGPRNK